MEDLQHRTRTVFTRVVWLGIALIVAGAIVLILAIGLEWRGFPGGLVQGAGIGAMVVGGYLWGFSNGIRRGLPRTGWLPSRGTSS